MDRMGWATIYDGGPALPGYSAAEAAARRQKIGLWRGNFERPSVWRRQHLTGFGGAHA
jgi:endonuclease YncB( thermonuclease family)